MKVAVRYLGTTSDEGGLGGANIHMFPSRIEPKSELMFADLSTLPFVNFSLMTFEIQVMLLHTAEV